MKTLIQMMRYNLVISKTFLSCRKPPSNKILSELQYGYKDEIAPLLFGLQLFSLTLGLTLLAPGVPALVPQRQASDTMKNIGNQRPAYILY